MNNIPHFDDVIDLDKEYKDEAPTTNSKKVQLKGKRSISSTNSIRNTKKVKGPLVGTHEDNTVHNKSRLEVVQKFARWMYDAGIPFNAVKYDSFGPAFEAIVALYGCGMKPPSYHEVRVPMLKLEMEHTKELLQDIEIEKTRHGCSLMVDCLSDQSGKSIINFLVNTPRGTMFIESVDASSYSHSGCTLFKLFDRIIKKVGPGDVVQIVTDSTSNNVRAGELVEEKYPHIYWTPCAAHCIDMMLEDILKLPHLKKTLEIAIAINTYIYNRTLLVNMMREFTGQRDMVRPAKTRFVTAFITLNWFKTHKKSLKQMFTSDEWNNSNFSREKRGQQVANTIFLPSFWKNINIAVKIGRPLLECLRMVDSEKEPPMGYMYKAMVKVKESIAGSFRGNFEKSEEIFQIIDTRWKCQLNRPLHAAGYYLNPALFYNSPNLKNDVDVIKGLFTCINKLALTEEEEVKIHTELPIYRRASGNFGNPIAKTPVAVWWRQYGASAPTLRKFALKVLSLTCTSSGCERNWSIFEDLHSKKRTRLEQQKLSDLVYIKYNRALRKRYEMRDTVDPIILDDAHVQDPNEWLTGFLEEEEDDCDLGVDNEEENDGGAYKLFVELEEDDESEYKDCLYEYHDI